MNEGVPHIARRSERNEQPREVPITEILREDEVRRKESEDLAQAAEIAAIEAVLEENPQIPQQTRSNRNLTRTLAAGLFALNLSVTDLFAEERDTEPTFTQEQMQIFERLTGMPFQELQGAYKLQMTVQPGPEEKYIVHVGQTHRSPDVLLRGATQKEVVAKQMQIESVVTNSIRANGLQYIFSEGIAEKDVAIDIRDYIRLALPELDKALGEDISTYERFYKVYEIYAAHEPNISNRAAYQYLGERMAMLSARLREAVEMNAVATKDDEDKEMLGFFRNALKLSGAMSFFTTGGEKPNPYTAGVDFKLLMEDKIENLLPAENADLNQRALASRKVTQSARTLYFQTREMVRQEISNANPEVQRARERRTELIKKGEQNLDEQERQELKDGQRLIQAAFAHLDDDPRISGVKQQMETAQKEEDRLLLSERNIQTLRNIEENDLESIAKGGSLGNVLVIYGSDHDFTDALTSWNAAASPHRTISRGLIKISPKGD